MQKLFFGWAVIALLIPVIFGSACGSIPSDRQVRGHVCPDGGIAAKLCYALRRLADSRSAAEQERWAEEVILNWKLRDPMDERFPNLFLLPLDANKSPVRWELFRNLPQIKTVLIDDASSSNPGHFREFELVPMSPKVILILRAFILPGPYRGPEASNDGPEGGGQ